VAFFGRTQAANYAARATDLLLSVNFKVLLLKRCNSSTR